MDYVTKDTALTATADAIREKTGTSDPITWLEELGFSEAIAGIEAGGDFIVETGTITLAENSSGSLPLEIASKGYAWPDSVFIYKKPSETTSGANKNMSMACSVFTNKTQASYAPNDYKQITYDCYITCYNAGTNNVYHPYVYMGTSLYKKNDSPSFPINWPSGNIDFFAGTTYSYVYIWGTTI